MVTKYSHLYSFVDTMRGHNSKYSKYSKYPKYF
jgi:hypothetical protein